MISSEFFDTQVYLVSTEELVLSSHARCVLSRHYGNEYSLLLNFYHSKIGRIKNMSCSARGHWTLLISFFIVQLRSLYVVPSLATLSLSTTSGVNPGLLPGFWGSMVFRHAPNFPKGSGNNTNTFTTRNK